MEKGEKIIFSKYDGGKPIASEGIFTDATSEHITVSYVGIDGVEGICKFRRAPGKTCGWGIGVARLWRLDAAARIKYGVPDYASKRK